MRFMQRSVASTSSTLESDTSSSKKRKTFHSPAQARVDASINQASVQAALEERESKRLAALEQHSTRDTQWVLNSTLIKDKGLTSRNPSLNIVYVGYGGVDSSDDENAPANGRTSTKTAQPKAC